MAFMPPTNRVGLAIWRLVHLFESPTREEERRNWMRLGQTMAQRQAEQNNPFLVPGPGHPMALPLPEDSDFQQRIHAALESCGPAPRPGEFFQAFAQARQTDPIPQVSRHTDALPRLRRITLFADVPDPSQQPDDGDGDTPTILTERVQRDRAWRKAIGQLLPPQKGGDVCD